MPRSGRAEFAWLISRSLNASESDRGYQKPQVSPLCGWPFFLTGARSQEKVKNRSWFRSSSYTHSLVIPIFMRGCCCRHHLKREAQARQHLEHVEKQRIAIVLKRSIETRSIEARFLGYCRHALRAGCCADSVFYDNRIAVFEGSVDEMGDVLGRFEDGRPARRVRESCSEGWTTGRVRIQRLVIEHVPRGHCSWGACFLA